jgi:hypothetical protein
MRTIKTCSKLVLSLLAWPFSVIQFKAYSTIPNFFGSLWLLFITHFSNFDLYLWVKMLYEWDTMAFVFITYYKKYNYVICYKNFVVYKTGIWHTPKLWKESFRLEKSLWAGNSTSETKRNIFQHFVLQDFAITCFAYDLLVGNKVVPS